MLEAIRRAISFLRHKQILHKLGVLISITVIGIACYVLYHMLRGIDIAEVIDAIKGTEPRQIVLAALFVSAGYFTLTFYDWFAVRAIGRTDVPYRVNATGRLHLLLDRPQCRRQRLHRRRGALSHLFGLGTERDRRRKDLLPCRPYLLARQCRRARLGDRLASGGRRQYRPASGLAQSHRRLRSPSQRWPAMWPGSGSSPAWSAAVPGR